MSVAVKDSWVVYDAGSTRGCSIERNTAGELVCVFTDSPYGGPGGRMMVALSGDEGRNWSQPALLTASAHGAEGSIIHGLGMSRLSSGALLVSLCDLLGKPSQGATTAFFTTVSTDGGRSWRFSPAKTEWDEVYPYGKILELSDGTLLAPVWGTRTRGERRRSGLLASADGGASWECRATIACDRFGMIPSTGFMETSVIELSDGRLLAVVSQWKLVGCSGRVLFRSISDDEGRTWSHYEPVDIEGSLPVLARAPSGRLLLAYRAEVGEEAGRKPRGVAVRTSEDEGKSWSPELLLENPKGSHANDPDAAYPALVNLRDGAVLVLFSARNPDGAEEGRPPADAGAHLAGSYFLAANVLEEA